jgi:hypothetical protein
MPWENIGSCGGAQFPPEREWAICQLEMGIRYLQCVCGEPPNGYELGVMWHENDSGDYPTIGISWDIEEACSFDPPSEYIERCRLGLQAFDEAISWSEINPVKIQERISVQIGVVEDADEASEER